MRDYDPDATEDDVDGDAHIIYDYDHSFDESHNSDGYVTAADSVSWRMYDDQPTRWRRIWWNRHRFIFVGAFLIPFVILALIGFAAARLDQDDSTPAAARPTSFPTTPIIGAWPLDVAFIPHTVPAMIRDDLWAADARRGYQFEGRAGEAWRMTVETQDILDPQIRLYEPSGGELAYNDDQYTGSLSAEIVVILPADGTYRLLVESATKSNGAAGTYLLTVFEE